MRVRLYRLHLDIDRQGKRVGDDVVRIAFGDIDALTPEPEHDGRTFGGVAGEVQTDRRIDHFGLPARLHVQFHHEVGVCVETPGEIVWQQRRHLAGSPSEKVTVGIGGRSRDQPVVARRRIRLVEAARRRGMQVIALTGATGGDLAALADMALKVPSSDAALVQEGHAALYHYLCARLDAEFSKDAAPT